jgi:hypothetical protein
MKASVQLHTQASLPEGKEPSRYVQAVRLHERDDENKNLCLLRESNPGRQASHFIWFCGVHMTRAAACSGSERDTEQVALTTCITMTKVKALSGLR